MGEHVVLSEKLRRPPPAGLVRPRLAEPLLDRTGPSLGLILAPPGSGKTTLLAQVAAHARVPVAWYRVTADDDSESAFARHLAHALHSALDLVAPPVDLAEILRVVDGREGNSLLVIDDLHEIIGTPAELALEHLVSMRPRRMRMLLATRRTPGFNLPRLLASGSVLEITSDDLRFRCWEVEQLFAEVHREPLSPESAAMLTRRTGGWAAGLQLFHLATCGRTPAARKTAVAQLSGQSRLIRSYLAQNVLAELPDARQQFLLRTCTLGLLTGPLCDALLGRSDSAAVLDELERQQMFTLSVDDGTTYRYHEVLQTHLELALMSELGHDEARRCYERSAALLEAAGAIVEAIRAYGKAEDWGAVARLIQRYEPHATTAGVAGMRSLLPAKLVDHDPWLALAEARRRLRIGDLRGAVAGYVHAESLLAEAEFQQRCRDERAAVTDWLPPSAGSPRRWTGEGGHGRWTQRIRAATRQVCWPLRQSPTPVWRGPTAGRSAEDLLADAGEALLRGDVYTAADLLATVSAAPAGGVFTNLAGRLCVIGVEMLTGREENPVTRLEEIALAADVDGLPWLARATRGLISAALAASRTYQLHRSATTELLDDCDRDGDDWGAALMLLFAGIAAGPDAIGLLDAAAERFRDLDAPVLELWALALAALRSARAELPEAGRLARRAESRARALHVRGAQAVAIAACALAAGAPAGSLDWRRAAEFADEAGLPDSLVGPPAKEVSVDVAACPAFVTCFGGFAITVDGRTADLAGLRPRARALLRLLALRHGRDVHREWLIDTFWPGASLAAGTRRLQVAISSIRQTLHATSRRYELLVRHGDAYRLELPAGGVVDAERFERLLGAADLLAVQGNLVASSAEREQALTLYRGELMPEDGLAEYLLPERDRYRLLASGAAMRLAAEHEALGRHQPAVVAAQLSVRLDPYSDLAWRQLADLHVAAGDLSAASRVRLEHHRACVELDASVRTDGHVLIGR